MKELMLRCAPPVAVLLTIAVGTVYCFSTLASIESLSVGLDEGKAVVRPATDQLAAGSVLVVRGSVTIEGNPAMTGETILSGSTITTHSNSEAIVDFASLGMVWIREQTSVMLAFTSGTIQVSPKCDSTRIEVRQGQVEVKLLRKSRREVLIAYNGQIYSEPVEILAKGGANFIVDCSGKRLNIEEPGRSGKGLIALILIGVGAAGSIFGAGIAESVPKTSPIR
jgi:hypothetical protein